MKAKIMNKIFLACLFFFTGIEAFAAQPDWNVNANQYVYSMTITGQLPNHDSITVDTNDLVAAFINGECRGVTRVKYQSVLEDYFVFLMIYSNDPVGTVSFKIYDASSDKEINVKETINFTVNDIVGSVSIPFIFSANNLNNEANLVSYSIPKQVGSTIFSGNLVSLKEHWSGTLTGIAASFVVSQGAKVYVNGVEQISGVTLNNFLHPVIYTVESADHSASTQYTVDITTAIDIPTDLILSNTQVQENGSSTFIGSLSVIRENPDDVYDFSFMNTSSTENNYFVFSGNELHALSSFNFEEKSVYKIYIRADNHKGGVIQKYFTIRVLNGNDTPTNIAFTNSDVPENATSNTVFGSLSAIDEDAGDSPVFTLVAGNGTTDSDNRIFRIDGNLVKNSVDLIFSSDTEYHILVKATDRAGASVTVPITISNKNQNNPPYNIILSNTLVEGIENPPLLVGTLSAEDVDQLLGHIYSLPVNAEFGADNDLFSITGNSLFLVSPEPVAVKNSYHIYITVTDSMDLQFSKGFVIQTREVHSGDGFYLNNDILLENKPFNTIVGYFDSENQQSSDYTFNLPLEVNLDVYSNNNFKLIGRTLLSNAVFDYETQNQVKLLLELTDGVTKSTQEVTVNIANQNDPPTAIDVSNQIISESTLVNSEIATLSTEDQDSGDSHSFSLVLGNGINDEGNSFFKMEGNKLILAKPLNFEAKEFHNVLLQVTDKSGAIFQQGLRLQVADANDAPEFVSKPVSYVLQDQVYVYVIEAIDSENDSISYSFDGLPSWLTYNESSNLISGVAGNDWVGVYNFSIKASDGKKESVQHVVLSVINVNDPPEINYYLGRQRFIAKQDNLVQIPPDCIIDPDLSDALTFNLSTESNSALPSWLNFDPVKLSISGNPPVDAGALLRLKLTGMDNGKLKEWMIFEVEVDYPTPAIDFHDNQLFSVFPNPVHNSLFINVPVGFEAAHISISNVAGQTLKTLVFGAGSRNQISFGEYPPGVYLIGYRQGKLEQTEKIIKQ